MGCVRWWWCCCLLTISKNRYSSALCATITILPATQEPRNRILHRIKKKMFSLLSTQNRQSPRRKYKKIFSSYWGHIHYTVLFSWKFLKLFFFLTKNLFFLVRVWNGERMEIYFVQLLVWLYGKMLSKKT